MKGPLDFPIVKLNVKLLNQYLRLIKDIDVIEKEIKLFYQSNQFENGFMTKAKALFFFNLHNIVKELVLVKFNSLCENILVLWQ